VIGMRLFHEVTERVFTTYLLRFGALRISANPHNFVSAPDQRDDFLGPLAVRRFWRIFGSRTSGWCGRVEPDAASRSW